MADPTIGDILLQAPAELQLGVTQGLRQIVVSHFHDNVKNIFNSDRSRLAPSSGSAGLPWRFTVTPSGGKGDMKGENGYQSYDINRYGIFMGLDHNIDEWKIGAAISIDRLEQDWDNYDGNADSNIFQPALFAGRRFGDWGFNGQLSYGHASVETERNIPILGDRASASYKRNWFGAGISAAYYYGQAGGWNLTPSVSLSYLRFLDGGFTEHWQGGSSMSFDKVKLNSFDAHVDITVKRNLSTSSRLAH